MKNPFKRENKEEIAFTGMIEYFQKLIITLPPMLLDTLKECANRTEVEDDEEVYVYGDSLVKPISDKIFWFDFSHIDLLWWRREFDRDKFLAKPVDQIRTEVNLFVLRVIEDNISMIEVNEDIHSIYIGIKESAEKGENYL